MREEIIYITVEDGKASNLKRLHETIYSFNGNIEVTVRNKRVRRSGNQNRYFHMLVGILGKELGYTNEEMKSIVKTKFLLREKVIEATGEVVQYVQETHLLSKAEFAEFTDHVIRWSAQMGIVLPLPEEQVKLQL